MSRTRIVRAYKFNRKRDIIHNHHLIYQKGNAEEKTGPIVKVFQGEHWAITQLQRRKRISKGFIQALEFWINEVKNTAIEL